MIRGTGSVEDQHPILLKATKVAQLGSAQLISHSGHGRSGIITGIEMRE
jgi:hypothetical protein